MKVAVVYNRDSKSVINLFGLPNREKIGLKTIRRLVASLKQGGHEVVSFEGDKDLIDRLEDFMPRVVSGERPGMVFNVSYGVQGQARYTHVPSILEMVGIPYVASGPMGHSLSLDKVVTKMILRQNGLPTPDFAVLQSPDSPVPKMKYPVVVKPRNESVSFGLKVVNNEKELVEAAKIIFDQFDQPVLAEQYIDGKEVNVGILGNNPPEAFPAVMLDFGKGPQIYSYEDKTGRSGRIIQPVCPAPISRELTRKAQDIAVRAFQALGLSDCCRVDMRIDKKQNLYILETNSLPSLGEHGSYLVGAAAVGLDFTKFVNRLVEVASARYFGTPEPPVIDKKKADPRLTVQGYITQRRGQIEKRVQDWVEISSRTSDPVGIHQAVAKSQEVFHELGMKPVPELTDDPEVWTWQTAAGLAGGTLLIANLDVPTPLHNSHEPFRRTAEWLYGEGIGTSRAAVVMLEFALRALRSIRKLRGLPLGVLLYTDEGRDAQLSAEKIRAAAAQAKRVLVLRPGAVGGGVLLRRRGNRKFRLEVRGESLASGRAHRQETALSWVLEQLRAISRFGTEKNQVLVSTLDLKTERHPMRLPHRVSATPMLTYLDPKAADDVEAKIRAKLGKKGPRWELLRESDRAPMKDRPVNVRLFKQLSSLAAELDIPLKRDSSTWPSVAGLVPAKVACLCGVGPATDNRGTPQEAVQRISLIQQTLLLATFLVDQLKK